MLEEMLNNLSLRYLIDYFLECGIIISPSRIYSKTELTYQVKIDKKFVRFFDYMLFALHAAHFIKLEEETIEFLIQINDLDSASLLTQKLISQFPEKEELINRISYFSAHYQQALSGMIPAISVLYPAANTHFLDPIISEMNIQSDLVWFQRFLKKLLAIASKKSPLTIMEVGGGLGSLTWEIAANLKGHQTKYYFTDISRFFILKARAVAIQKNISLMQFAQFDVTKSAKEQNFEENSIDILLACNVLHATQDLQKTLIHLRKLLRPTGTLLIIEHTNLPLWLHLIWGFAEGWWYFTDGFRKIVPLIGASQWRQALLAAGYQNIRTFKKNDAARGPLSLLGISANIHVL